MSEVPLYGVPLASGEGTPEMVLNAFARKMAQAKTNTWA